MGMLLLDRAGLEVRYADGALAMYEDGQRRSTVPLKLIDRLVIQGARTRIDNAALIHLAEAGVPTLLLSSRRSRQVAIVLGPAHNDAAVRLAQARLAFDNTFCDQWARHIVLAKLQRQHKLIRRAETTRPEHRKALYDAQAGIASAIRSITDEPDCTCTRLRGLEGSAARAYFGGFTTLFAPELGFNGRNRRPPRDPVNACLSLAYTLLHFEAVRAAHIAGVDPLIGFYHRPAFGRESLACDLIEPMRPAVDNWLLCLFANGTLRPSHFNQDRDACLLGKAGRSHFYEAWANFTPAPQRWLRTRTRQLAQRLRQDGEPLLAQFEELEDELS